MSRKNRPLLVIIFLLTFCSPLVAQSQLTISKEFEVISVNGKAHTQNSQSKGSLLELNSGLNKIALAYESEFKNTNGDFETIKSDIFIVSFYLPSNNRYRLLHLKQANLIAAKKFVQNPIINIISQQGASIKSKQHFPTSQSKVVIHQSTEIKLKTQQPIRLVSKKSSDKQQEKISLTKDPESMLLYWWQQANPQQRQSFLKKIKSSN